MAKTEVDWSLKTDDTVRYKACFDFQRKRFLKDFLLNGVHTTLNSLTCQKKCEFCNFLKKIAFMFVADNYFVR